MLNAMSHPSQQPDPTTAEWPPLVDALWNIADDLRRLSEEDAEERDKSEASGTVDESTTQA